MQTYKDIFSKYCQVIDRAVEYGRITEYAADYTMLILYDALRELDHKHAIKEGEESTIRLNQARGNVADILKALFLKGDE